MAWHGALTGDRVRAPSGLPGSAWSLRHCSMGKATAGSSLKVSLRDQEARKRRRPAGHCKGVGGLQRSQKAGRNGVSLNLGRGMADWPLHRRRGVPVHSAIDGMFVFPKIIWSRPPV